jgi:hypothetical protein
VNAAWRNGATNDGAFFEAASVVLIRRH